METRFLRFRRLVMSYYRRHGRHELPWRKTIDPYAVLISEVMLQQTQVDRVIPYFERFIKRFPNFGTLARARTSSVLTVWQGLGYNRRALMLHRCARVAISNHGGVLPHTLEELEELPGIGPYTAGAVMAFAFNKPHPIIETNIRRAYIYHFFPGKRAVDDSGILPLIEASMNRRRPRVWFSALMDYGSWLAEKVENPNRRSIHYVRQSIFEGSERQLRGRVLKTVLSRHKITMPQLKKTLKDARLSGVVTTMIREGFLVREGKEVRCA